MFNEKSTLSFLALFFFIKVIINQFGGYIVRVFFFESRFFFARPSLFFFFFCSISKTFSKATPEREDRGGNNTFVFSVSEHLGTFSAPCYTFYLVE